MEHNHPHGITGSSSSPSPYSWWVSIQGRRCLEIFLEFCFPQTVMGGTAHLEEVRYVNSGVSSVMDWSIANALSPRKVKAAVEPKLGTTAGCFLLCVCGWERQCEEGELWKGDLPQGKSLLNKQPNGSTKHSSFIGATSTPEVPKIFKGFPYSSFGFQSLPFAGSLLHSSRIYHKS